MDDYIPEWLGGPPKNLPRGRARQNMIRIADNSTRKPVVINAKIPPTRQVAP
jgi:hypothetical protein